MEFTCACFGRYKNKSCKIVNCYCNGIRYINDLVYSYMARPPAYSTALPLFVYLKTGSTADDFSIFANSLYRPAPTTTPTGTVRLPWLSTQINTTSLARFATGFTPGRSELFPIPQSALNGNFNLTQNPGY
jgi:hypothetical protein